MPKGFADIHNHQFANLGFGGLAVWGGAYGDISHELSWCTYPHGPGGIRDTVGNLLAAAGHIGGAGHKNGGYPQFDGWPRWNSFTHQSVFEDWLFRAYQGGLRLIVVLAVNNEWLCSQVATAPNRTCNDMEAVRYQLRAAQGMEAYIDQKSGGAGQGWYRIAYSPDEAQQTIDDGKLAVVLGIEVDYLFNAHTEGDLTLDQLRAELDHYFNLGARHLFPIHFSDNGFGGTAFQNQLIHDTTLLPSYPLATPWNPAGTGPAYGVATEDATAAGYEYRTGRRNVQGLTNLGKSLIWEMMERGTMIDVDHASFHTRADILDIAEARPGGYPVVSGHTGFVEISHGDKSHEGQLLPDEVERIRKLGGMIAPIINQGTSDQISAWEAPNQTAVPHTCGSTTQTWVQAYLYVVSKMEGAPVAFGTDFNGMINPIGPRFGLDACPGGPHTLPLEPPQPPLFPPAGKPIEYPFTAVATGTQLDHCVAGDRTFDFNIDGLAHIGLLPDLIADLESLGLTSEDLDPLLNSAEGYIAAWRKAWSLRHVEPPECDEIRKSGSDLQQQIDALTASLVGLNPRDPQDRAEIKSITADRSAKRGELLTLKEHASSIGCFTV